MPEKPSNVAVYWDFENVQASLVEKKGGPGAYGRTKYQAQEALIDVESVMEYAATFGVVSINRAYCNWQWYGKYRETLLHNGLELIQLFHPGASAKNGGDIKLCLDCTEDLLRFPHIDVVVVVGGDSDYLPVAQKVKAMGKTLVGIGVEANTNRHWAHACHEFKFYEALILDDEPIALPAPAPSAPAAVGGANPAPAAPLADPDKVVKARPEELLRRAIRRLAGNSADPWVLKGAIRPMMKRLDPTFEEEQHGCRSFSAFMKKFESLLDVRAGRNDQEVRLKDRAPGPERARDERPERERSDRGERRGDRRDERKPPEIEPRPAEIPGVAPSAPPEMPEAAEPSRPIKPEPDEAPAAAPTLEPPLEPVANPTPSATKAPRTRSRKAAAPKAEGEAKAPAKASRSRRKP